MENLRECRRCLLRESAQADVFEDIEERIKKLKPEERADSALYERRLGVCRACDSLISGVCMKCGCYPEFRAAFLNMRCPDRDKWAECARNSKS